MALVALPGAPVALLGPGEFLTHAVPAGSSITLDAANEAAIYIGQICTSDGGSHTIDTTGSSSLGWRAGASTFANAGTTVKVGLASVLTTVGPPARAVNVSDVITFDVSRSMTGGGGDITSNSWHTHIPDTGTKTIAHGDLIAFCVQMTARGGVDLVLVAQAGSAQAVLRPTVTEFTGGAYTADTRTPNVIITFSDGAFGFIEGSELYSTLTTRTWNSGSATKEYGQLYRFGFPLNVYGIYGWAAAPADFAVVLYSTPLATPVAERTVSIDANTVSTTLGRRFSAMFASPYSMIANADYGFVFKPGASNISAYYRTLASAAHRVADIWGTSGYGISRATGSFASENSLLDHYYIGLIAGAFEAGGGAAGRAVQVNPQSLVSS